MTRIDASTVARLASLARVGLPPERVPQLVAELNGILEHMDVLSAADVASGAAAEQSVEGMALRPDLPVGRAGSNTLAQIAPESRDGFVLVPRLSSHDDPGAA